MLYFMFYLTAFCIFLAFCEVISLTLRHCKECYEAPAKLEGKQAYVIFCFLVASIPTFDL